MKLYNKVMTSIVVFFAMICLFQLAVSMGEGPKDQKSQQGSSTEFAPPGRSQSATELSKSKKLRNKSDSMPNIPQQGVAQNDILFKMFLSYHQRSEECENKR